MKQITFIEGYNHFEIADNPCLWTTINIWSGTVANIGESQLSKFVEKNNAGLKTLLYCPQKTKGGTMLRPLYDKADRGGSVEFPELNELGIPAVACLQRLPIKWGYIAPKLKTLKVFFLFDFRDDEQLEKFSQWNWHVKSYIEAWDKFHDKPELLNTGYSLEKIQYCCLDVKNPGQYHIMDEHLF